MVVLKRLVIRFFKLIQKMAQDATYDGYRRKYNVSESFRFNGVNIYLYGEGKIILGEGSYIGSLSTLQSDVSAKIAIGRNCRISHNVRIYTTTNYPDQDFTHTTLTKKTGSVIIGDGVWLGVNVFVSPGVSIGDNAIVGANSVVNKDIPANAIYGGVPAKLIRMKTFDD